MVRLRLMGFVASSLVCDDRDLTKKLPRFCSRSGVCGLWPESPFDMPRAFMAALTAPPRARAGMITLRARQPTRGAPGLDSVSCGLVASQMSVDSRLLAPKSRGTDMLGHKARAQCGRDAAGLVGY